MMRDKTTNKSQNTTNFQMVAPILEPFAWYFRLVASFVCDWSFNTSGGYYEMKLQVYMKLHYDPLCRSTSKP